MKRAKTELFRLQIVTDDLRENEVLDEISFVFFFFFLLRGGGGVEIFFFPLGGVGVHPIHSDPSEPRLPAGAPPPISLLNLQFRAPRRVSPSPPSLVPSPPRRRELVLRVRDLGCVSADL